MFLQFDSKYHVRIFRSIYISTILAFNPKLFEVSLAFMVWNVQLKIMTKNGSKIFKECRGVLDFRAQ